MKNASAADEARAILIRRIAEAVAEKAVLPLQGIRFGFLPKRRRLEGERRAVSAATEEIVAILQNMRLVPVGDAVVANDERWIATMLCRNASTAAAYVIDPATKREFDDIAARLEASTASMVDPVALELVRSTALEIRAEADRRKNPRANSMSMGAAPGIVAALRGIERKLDEVVTALRPEVANG